MSYVLSLVWAWLVEHPEYHSIWINEHFRVRWNSINNRSESVLVAGHWRKLHGYASLMPSLACTCKFERLVIPKLMPPPATAIRERRDEGGALIPREYRALIWV